MSESSPSMYTCLDYVLDPTHPSFRGQNGDGKRLHTLSIFTHPCLTYSPHIGTDVISMFRKPVGTLTNSVYW